jgi:PAS domain S-box-containing protein
MTDDARPLEAKDLPFQVILEHLPVIVYVDTWDTPVPQTIYISPTVEALLGYPPSLYLEPSERWLSTVHPDDLAGMRAELARYAEGERPYELVYRFVHPDGHHIWVRDRATPYRDPATGEVRWMGALEDISAQIEAEAAEEVSSHRYETLLENVPAVVYEMDPDDDRQTRYVNRKIEELLGYTMEEWLGQPDMWTEVLHPDDREKELAAHDLASSTGEPWRREYRLIGADGQVVWVRDQAVLLGDMRGASPRWQGVMVDITPEKEAQLALVATHEELEFRVRARTAQLVETNELMGVEIAERRRAQEEMLRAESHLGYLAHNLPAVVYLWQTQADVDGSWLSYVGDQIAPMLGYTPDEWNDGGWRHRVHPHDLDMVDAAVAHSIQTGEPFRLQYRYLARDGRVVWVLDHATLAQRGADGGTLLFEGVMIDITEMKEAERTAAVATDRFAEIVQRGPVVLYAYSVDPDEPDRVSLDYLSPQLEQMLGMPLAAWIDDPWMWFDAIHPDDRDRSIQTSKRTWRTGERWESEYRIIAGDGSIKWLADRGTCVERDHQGRPVRFVGSIADSTARREEIAGLRAELEPFRAALGDGLAVAWGEYYDPGTGLSHFTYVSPSVVGMLGYTPEELIQEDEHFPRLIHPDDVDRVVATFELVAPTGRWDDHYRVIARDGSVHRLDAHGWRISPPGERPEHWTGVTIDVTDRFPSEILPADADDAVGVEELS